ncbi:hemicentin-1-like [Pollicipes pollicipes]|uniref:hemicentin-1-like n=1 Tax=Pollicipes pollicipes TaxID=41117 RepID=UPI00188530B6|nr:hemicentin-1-like [Pollicipes pollicipes]
MFGMGSARCWTVLLLTGFVTVTGRVQQIDITGLVGDEVRLPCEIDETKCGDVHNIQWYRGDGDTRVFIYSELAKVDTSENMLQGRGYFEYAKGSSTTELEIRNLRPDDESLYKCELTYLEVRDDCAVIQFVNLTTLAKPENIRILLEDGTEVSPGSVIGPYEEDSDLVLRCESAGGKPAAAVTWWNDTVNMGGAAGAVLSADGTGLGTNVIRVPLTRHDLGSGLECQATNPASRRALRSTLYIDLHVRPRSVELDGWSGAVREGTMVTLTCKVSGARPAANITWLAGGQEVATQSNSSVHTKADGTADTVSTLTFRAVRSAHRRPVACVASNAVIESKAESPLRATVTVQVLYAPSVTVTPDNMAANESADVLLFCGHDANPANLTAVTWYKSGRQLDLTDEDKYEGGTLEQPSLFIKNASRRDAGRYRCEVANEIGGGMADNEAVVHVQYPPEVSLTVTPSVATESARPNVTGRCDVTSGEPAELLWVRWYRDGELLPDPPPCRPSGAVFGGGGADGPCSDEPGQITLLSVTRMHMANYSCAGLSRAGWGPLSRQKQLLVHYPPHQAAVTHEPTVVLKDMQVTLTCEVDDLGYPPAGQYLWMRGSHVVTDIRTRQWRVDAASLEEDDRFGCVAHNVAGSSTEGAALLDVLAKPRFIERPSPYVGALINSSSIAVTCRVECSPLCELEWLKDGQVIEDGSYYSIKTGALEPDPRTNDFESVVSTLTWNITAWPNQTLDRVRDNANYTCRSTSNTVGLGVSSTTLFTVEYPPLDVTVTPAVLSVEEGAALGSVHCTSSALPAASHVWTRDDEVIQTGGRLRLDASGGASRTHSGEYLCRAQNKHGAFAAPLLVRVMYVPECSIGQMEQDGEYLLVCTVDAVPDDVAFTWRFDNETLTERIRTEGTVSTLTVRPGSRDFGTYHCLVNNSIGAGLPCNIDVAGVSGWQMSLDGVSVIMVITTVTATAVTVAVVCAVMFRVCRHRRPKDRYGVPDPLQGRDAFYHREERALIRPSLLPGPPSNPDIVKLPGSDSSTKSSTNGSGSSSVEGRPLYESLSLHRPPCKPIGGGAGGRVSSRQSLPSNPSHGHPTDSSQSRPTDSSQSRPPSELSQNGSSGYGSTFSQGNPQYGSMRSQHSFQYGSTRSQRADPERHGQQLLPIPQSPDLPDTPTTLDETTQSEANNNDCERPTPPQRGPAAKPPYHNLSLPHGGNGARQRQAQNQAERQKRSQNQTESQLQSQSPPTDAVERFCPQSLGQTPPGPHAAASRGFYSCSQPGSTRLCHVDVVPASEQRPPQQRPASGSAPRPWKEYVPTEYAVMQFSGASHEIDV